MRLVRDQGWVGNWVTFRLFGHGRGYRQAVCCAIVDEVGGLVGGVVLHDWQPEFRRVEMSCVADHPRWLSRQIVSSLAEIVCDQMGCDRVVLRCAEENHAAFKVMTGLGNGNISVIEGARGDVGECMTVVTRDQLIDKGFLKKSRYE